MIDFNVEHINIYTFSNNFSLRLVEEVKMNWGGIQLENSDVYMATTLEDFVKACVLIGRGVSTKKEFTYDPVSS